MNINANQLIQQLSADLQDVIKQVNACVDGVEEQEHLNLPEADKKWSLRSCDHDLSDRRIGGCLGRGGGLLRSLGRRGGLLRSRHTEGLSDTRRQDHLVDDVHDAVVGLEVSGDDLSGLVDEDRPTVDGDADRLTLDRGDLLAVQRRDELAVGSLPEDANDILRIFGI